MQDNKNENNIKITFAELKHMIAEALVEQLGAAGSPSPDVGEEPLGPEESLEVQALMEKYMGFKKLKKSLSGKGVKDPGAVAASIGRRKYGKEKFQKAAAKGKSLREQVDSKSYGYTDKRSDEYVRYAASVLRDELQSGLDGLMFTKVKTSERANSFVRLGDDAIARDLTVSSHGVGEYHGVTGNMSVLVHKHQDAKYDTDSWDAEQDDDGPALLSSFDGIRVFIMFRSRELNSKLSFRFEYETPVEEIVETLRTQFVPLLNQNLEEYIKGPDGDY